MNTKHILKSYASDMKTAHCYQCGDDSPVIKNKGKYYCANSDALVLTPKDIPDRILARHKAFTSKTDRLQRVYTLTYYQYLLLLDDHNYACAICLDTFTKDNPAHIDHDHSCCPNKTSCGECIRGLLCRMCNTGIGYFRDDVQALTRAVSYLDSP